MVMPLTPVKSYLPPAMLSVMLRLAIRSETSGLYFVFRFTVGIYFSFPPHGGCREVLIVPAVQPLIFRLIPALCGHGACGGGLIFFLLFSLGGLRFQPLNLCPEPLGLVGP